MDRWLKKTGIRKETGNTRNEERKATSSIEDTEVSEPAAQPSATTRPSLIHVQNKRSAFSSSGQQPAKKKRKYDPRYLSYGFTRIGDEEAPDAICILCDTILANSSLAPAKLQRHMETKHSSFKNKDISFFERKLESYNRSRSVLVKKCKTENEIATEASYKASYHISLHGEAHTIGESLIKPILKDVVSCVFNEESVQKVEAISLSNNTVSRRITDIADDIETELISRLHASDAYALQMDESTDVAGLAILLVFVRYDYENKIEDNILFCKSLELHTTGKDIFDCIDDFIRIHGIGWEKCISVCTDGAKAMTGKLSGAVTRIKNVAKNSNSNHCILHRYALVTKRISASLKTVLDEAVQIINFIKTRPLQSRIFKALCEDLGSHHTTLLLHTEVRWLSRGNVLVRMFELRKELLSYFLDHKFRLSDRLRNNIWLSKVAYLADIFSKLNETCLSLQRKETNIFRAQDNMISLSRKLQYWTSEVEHHNFDCFPLLTEFLQELEVDLDTETFNDMKGHLNNLSESLIEYFPNLTNKDHYWVQNPFKVADKPSGFLAKDYEYFIEITSDTQLKAKFEEVPLDVFWGNLRDEYPEISKRAERVLLPFATTYLCESGFSRYASTKTKYRSKLDATPDMRIQLSSIKPNFQRIMRSKKQMHSSH